MSRTTEFTARAALAAVLLPLAGCSTETAIPVTAPVTTSSVTTSIPTTTTKVEQAGWASVALVGGRIAVETRAITEPDGHVVTLFRFHPGSTRFALHAGTTDPAVPADTIGPDNGPVIGPNEQSVLLAAFNGGFKTSSGSGGFELDSQAFVPLEDGLASLVIDADGTARVGIWGQGLPALGERVASVRQNLVPLVVHGQLSPQISDITTWGSILGGGAVVARSSLGEDSDGNLIYAAGMETVPGDLADALIGVGAVTAMELDINPEWVQLDSAPFPGGPLVTGIPGQDRPADQYRVGWTRDFVTVLSRT